MRLFLALLPDDTVRGVLRELPEPPPPWRPTDPDTWHVTLVFLGDVDPDRVPSLTTEVGEVCSTARPVTLRLGALVRLGPALVHEVTGGAALIRLQRDCEQAVATAGIDVERRAYRPHLTIARGRGRGAPPPRPLPGPVAWTVDEVVLIRSHPPQPGGPPRHRHELLETLPLGGRGPRGGAA